MQIICIQNLKLLAIVDHLRPEIGNSFIITYILKAL